MSNEIKNINNLSKKIKINSNNKIKEITRIGKYIPGNKPRPIKITLENKLDKLGLINNASLLKNTKYYHIGISNFYNKTELQKLKKLQLEAKKCIDDTHIFKVRFIKG